MDELKNLIEKAIKNEEDFIESYLNLAKDEGFENNREKAKDLLDVLIEESKEHKKTLEEIINNL